MIVKLFHGTLSSPSIEQPIGMWVLLPHDTAHPDQHHMAPLTTSLVIVEERASPGVEVCDMDVICSFSSTDAADGT